MDIIQETSTKSLNELKEELGKLDDPQDLKFTLKLTMETELGTTLYKILSEDMDESEKQTYEFLDKLKDLTVDDIKNLYDFVKDTKDPSENQDGGKKAKKSKTKKSKKNKKNKKTKKRRRRR